jgi:hypothetical protein
MLAWIRSTADSQLFSVLVCLSLAWRNLGLTASKVRPRRRNSAAVLRGPSHSSIPCAWSATAFVKCFVTCSQLAQKLGVFMLPIEACGRVPANYAPSMIAVMCSNYLPCLPFEISRSGSSSVLPHSTHDQARVYVGRVAFDAMPTRGSHWCRPRVPASRTRYQSVDACSSPPHQ